MQSTATPLEPLQDEEQASKTCGGLHPKTLYNARRRKELGYVQLGSRIFYEPAELRRWIAAHRVPASK